MYHVSGKRNIYYESQIVPVGSETETDKGYSIEQTRSVSGKSLRNTKVRERETE